MFECPPMGALAPHVGTAFRLRAETGRVLELELTEVQPYGEGVGGMERFSLYFRGPADTYLPQATYRLEHDAEGEFDLFIVPVRRDERGFHYEAVVNRDAR